MTDLVGQSLCDTRYRFGTRRVLAGTLGTKLTAMPTEIRLTSRVQIQDDVLFQELQGEAVLLNLKTGMYLGLDRTGTRIWKLLEQDGSLSRVVDVVLQEYDVTREKFEQDLLNLIGEMLKHGLLVEAA